MAFRVVSENGTCPRRGPETTVEPTHVLVIDGVEQPGEN
jgi:hypothetical protein